jgi:hypothetical protein
MLSAVSAGRRVVRRGADAGAARQLGVVDVEHVHAAVGQPQRRGEGVSHGDHPTPGTRHGSGTAGTWRSAAR